MIKLSFVGDIMCLKAQNEASYKKYGKLLFSPQLAHCEELFRQSDYVIGNLETPICPSKPLTQYDIKFNSSIEFAKAIQEKGIQFVSLANNHILDQGIDGLEETIKSVKQIGFDCSGAYISKKKSENIFIKIIGGLKISIICCTFSTNSQVNGIFLPKDELWRVDLLNKQKKMLKHWEPNPNAVCQKYIADELSIAAATNSSNIPFQESLKSKIAKAKEISDFVILMPHMGGQYNPHPGYYTTWMMDFIKECGANMIIAGHPHVVQKCRWDNDVFECFSLGNFLCTPNTGWYLPHSFSEYGIVLHIYISKEHKNIEKVTFSIVKNIVDEYGYTTVIPVTQLFKDASTIERERLHIDCEEIISRIRGYNDNLNTVSEEITIQKFFTKA